MKIDEPIHLEGFTGNFRIVAMNSWGRRGLREGIRKRGKSSFNAHVVSGQKRGIQEMHKKRAGRQAALLFFFLSSDD
ncbi:hypothetical protein [Brevibacillus sp. FIR094]|uniref:hypothetical protein n=1 Tax=Brevibacillus sp. FIR094 TaxID=3134809 RepID=UPI003D238931